MPIDHLTARQIEVLRRLCAGETPARVAGALGLAVGTVRNHRTEALTRIPVGTTLADVCRELDGAELSPSGGRPPDPGRETGLAERVTARQRAILRRLCAGERYADIAAADGVAVLAVRMARAKAMSRMPMGTAFADVCRELAGHEPPGGNADRSGTESAGA